MKRIYKQQLLLKTRRPTARPGQRFGDKSKYVRHPKHKRSLAEDGQ